MQELTKPFYDRVIPIYLSAKSAFPLIRAVIENKQEGRIFVDNQSKPTTCIVVTKFGFLYFFGNVDNNYFNASVGDLVFNSLDLKQTYLLWYNTPAGWLEKLNQFGKGIFKQRERIRYTFDMSKFYSKKSQPNSDKFQLKQIDKNLCNQMEHFGIDFPTRFWRSKNDFLKNGFGFCVLHGMEVIGICYTACVVGGVAEVDIAVLGTFRGNKIGSILSHRFIEYCIIMNVEPTWDCFTYNKPSRRIAERMGFNEIKRYPFFSFNRPIKDEAILSELVICD